MMSIVEFNALLQLCKSLMKSENLFCVFYAVKAIKGCPEQRYMNCEIQRYLAAMRMSP